MRPLKALKQNFKDIYIYIYPDIQFCSFFYNIIDKKENGAVSSHLAGE